MHRTWWPRDTIAEVLRLAGAGLSDTTIAAATGVAATTVRNHRSGRVPRS